MNRKRHGQEEIIRMLIEADTLIGHSVAWDYAKASPSGGRSGVQRTSMTLPGTSTVSYVFGTSGSIDNWARRVTGVQGRALEALPFGHPLRSVPNDGWDPTGVFPPVSDPPRPATVPPPPPRRPQPWDYPEGRRGPGRHVW